MERVSRGPDAEPTEANVYADPDAYDLANPTVYELPILLPLAEQTGGPILDLACGTGRTTLALAEAGYVVTGVDLSEPMLRRARDVFDTRFPSSANLDKPEGEEPRQTFTDPDGRTIDVSVIWSYDPMSQVQDYTWIEPTSDGAGSVEESRSRGRLRYTWPLELERLLHAHGFDVETIHGGWDGSPLTATSREMVVVACERPTPQAV